jgi:hypothetical protein
MPTIEEEDDDATIITSNLSNNEPRSQPTYQTGVSPHNPAPKQRTVNGHCIGSKRNIVTNIKRKRMQRLIDELTAADKKLRVNLPNSTTPSTNPPTMPTTHPEFVPLITYHMPTPKASKQPTPFVSQSQDELANETPGLHHNDYPDSNNNNPHMARQQSHHRPCTISLALDIQTHLYGQCHKASNTSSLN